MKKLIFIMLMIPFFHAFGADLNLNVKPTYQRNTDPDADLYKGLHTYQSDKITEDSSNPGGFTNAEQMLNREMYDHCYRLFGGPNLDVGANQLNYDACRPFIEYRIKMGF